MTAVKANTIHSPVYIHSEPQKANDSVPCGSWAEGLSGSTWVSVSIVL